MSLSAVRPPANPLAPASSPTHHGGASGAPAAGGGLPPGVGGPGEGTTRPTAAPAPRAWAFQPPPQAPLLTPGPGKAVLSAAHPDETDPELWSLLSYEERAHLARLGTPGPLVYGRSMTSIRVRPPTFLGARIDQVA